MKEVTLAAHAGRPTGSRSTRRLRRDGDIPAILYGHGITPVPLAVDGRELRVALSTEAGVNALITLEVDGDRHLAMARQLQRDPVRGTVRHVDFVVVSRDEVVTADVPVHLVGEAEDVVHAGGVIDQALFSLAVHARPGDLPPSIEVDVSGLGVGDIVRVGDLRLPSGVTTEIDAEEAVASAVTVQVELPEEAVPEEEAEAAAGAEGEAAEGEAAGAEGPDGGGAGETAGAAGESGA